MDQGQSGPQPQKESTETLELEVLLPLEEEESLNVQEYICSRVDTAICAVPMDTIEFDGVSVKDEDNKAFSKKRIFEAASKGTKDQLVGLLEHLQITKQKLTDPDFTDEENGKTALLKALLNLKDGKNDTIDFLLDIAENTDNLTDLVNVAYKDVFSKGQTALHIAIERRSFDYVKLLVQKGADVQAKADGKFFKPNATTGFYFGELPLSLAACTNQLDVVSFLMDNPYRCADLTDKDSQGNTVLHVLAIIDDNSPENTDFITTIYDAILIQHAKNKTSSIDLEAIENNEGLTPMKLAAKRGKLRLLKHIVLREFRDEETRQLSRKFTEWMYGPIHSSLYDISSLDTSEDKSVLELIVYGSDIPNRHEMLRIEPLHKLLELKWNMFAGKMFLVTFLGYLIYLGIFTTVALARKEGQPPFPVENTAKDCLRCIGEVISVLGALLFFIRGIIDFKRKPPNIQALYLDGFCDILFFLQGALLLLCAVLYVCGKPAYVGPLVISLAIAWMNILYYARGSKHMGIYNVMMQRMILRDVLRFLVVYIVFLFGFSAAIVALVEDMPTAADTLDNNGTQPLKLPDQVQDSDHCGRPDYNSFGFTVLEMFKFTLGLGSLEFSDQVQYKEVFFILLIFYIVLTFILLLNMLIALMGDTMAKISQEGEIIWQLQRASTILDLEKVLPQFYRNRMHSWIVKRNKQESRRFFRVVGANWQQWRSNMEVIDEEDPGDQEEADMRRVPWKISPVLRRLGDRIHHPRHAHI